MRFEVGIQETFGRFQKAEGGSESEDVTSGDDN